MPLVISSRLSQQDISFLIRTYDSSGLIDQVASWSFGLPAPLLVFFSSIGYPSQRAYTHLDSIHLLFYSIIRHSLRSDLVQSTLLFLRYLTRIVASPKSLRPIYISIFSGCSQTLSPEEDFIPYFSRRINTLKVLIQRQRGGKLFVSLIHSGRIRGHSDNSVLCRMHIIVKVLVVGAQRKTAFSG